jgi:hypothetical protein
MARGNRGAMSYEETTVATKLRDSPAAHQAALEARRRRDFATATTELRRAYTLRADAHNLDPEHDAPTWQEEDRNTPRGRNTHDDMMSFYRQQLDKEPTDAVRESAPQQPAAESAAQPGESEPIAADAAQSEPEQSAEQAEPGHSASARISAKRLQRKARHG